MQLYYYGSLSVVHGNPNKKGKAMAKWNEDQEVWEETDQERKQRIAEEEKEELRLCQLGITTGRAATVFKVMSYIEYLQRQGHNSRIVVSLLNRALAYQADTIGRSSDTLPEGNNPYLYDWFIDGE